MVDAAHDSNRGNAVLIDPGRGDLLYCMHEDSTPENPMLFRYTSNRRRKELQIKKRRRDLSRRMALRPELQPALDRIAAHSHRQHSLAAFSDYLRARSAETHLLAPFFGQTFHRQARWTAFQLQQKADTRLAKDIRRKYGEDPLLIIGDHTSPHMRYQEPARGLGMRQMLVRQGFRIKLIDEFNTSKICPRCDNVTTTFLMRPNPRPWRDGYRLVHGLKNCNGCGAIWNRDLAATLNFLRILQAHRSGEDRPAALRRVTET